MSPRNQLNAESNKTLRTRCDACGAETPAEVGSNPAERQTWALVGTDGGGPRVFAVCAACYRRGWRPSQDLDA